VKKRRRIRKWKNKNNYKLCMWSFLGHGCRGEKANGQNGHKGACCSDQAIASKNMLKSMILVRGK